MKSPVKIIILLTVILISGLSTQLVAGTSPPDPGGDPSGGGPPVGGGAPINNGTIVMIIAASAYAAYKIVQHHKTKKIPEL